MRDDFAAFILTHGRPDRVHTYKTIRAAGYSGRVFFVVDDEDETLEQYRERYGAENVLVFSKAEIAETFDEADTFGDRRTIVYARNAAFRFARELGIPYFIQLDDDYTSFHLRFNARNEYGHTPSMKRSLDEVFEILLDFLLETPATTVALSQGGDHIGGDADGKRVPRLTRKAMNTFICATDRPFEFFGRVNEDVNAYTTLGRRGVLFFTVIQAQVNQLMTQSNAGGMTESYLDSGTYLKSFYSVLYSPSCVRVGVLADPRSPHARLHHAIDWRRAVPKILPESTKKAAGAAR